ncbi:hypothetical protein HOLleu_23474 [Holothuria leucospilota]|uniref:Uncharacterized protein n=1 Tax=Holothuria leucospilota TaxID=206669 RepID=A0A9Q1BUX0_HOLLE|nr:hypothetical protein HOLleu_23474 [Holothuria leucospilota]
MIFVTEGSPISATSITLGTKDYLPTSEIDLRTNQAGVTEQANTTSSRSSSNGSTLEQGQSYFPIWVIFVIIAIVVISICAVAGVFIRRRTSACRDASRFAGTYSRYPHGKHHDHQPANNVNTEKVNGPTNEIKDNMKNDKDVIPNPTYGQEPVNEKEDEYNSYTEIDVKVPGNTEMIYNSAYESPPASSGMVYNSAYESEETNNDMIYNSAYESSPSN